MRADLRFNVGDVTTGLRVTDGIIGLETATDTQWPLDAINLGLANFYNRHYTDTGPMVPPALYLVRDSRAVVGYIVMTRSDRYSPEELYQAFWRILEENGLGIASTGTFTADTPLVTSGTWDGVEVEVVAYQSEYGPGIPCQAVNDAFELLAGQSDWPVLDFLYLYPVRKVNGPQTNGLWVSRAIENLAETPDQDDAAFRRVRRLNEEHDVPALYPRYVRREYTFA